MANNTVHHVTAKDTTESSKRRKAAIDEAERKAKIPKLERRNPRAVPVSREAYREIMDTSKGQGNDQRFLDDAAKEALVNAAFGVAGDAVSKVISKPIRSAVKKVKDSLYKRMAKKAGVGEWEPDDALQIRAEAEADRLAFEKEMDLIGTLEKQAARAATDKAIRTKHFELGSEANLQKVYDELIPLQEGSSRKMSLVAARLGQDQGIVGHPSYMVIPADSPMRAAAYLQKKAQFGIANGGTDITLVPLSSVSPATDSRNVLFTSDAYTKSLPDLFDEVFGKNAFDTMKKRAISTMSKRRKTDGSPVTLRDVELQVQRRASDMVNKAVRPGSEQTYDINIPGIGRLEGINDATRKKIYDRFNKTGEYAEAKLSRVLSDKERLITIQPSSALYDPDSGRSLLIGGQDSYPEDLAEAIVRVRQDSKGGEASGVRAADTPEKRESTAPTDEQIAEALEFLRMFRERETPSNEWEAKALDRLERLVSTVVSQTTASPKRETAIPVSEGGERADELGGTAVRTDEDKPDDQNPEPEPGPVPEPGQGPESPDADPSASPAAEPLATTGTVDTPDTGTPEPETAPNPVETAAADAPQTDKLGRPKDGVRRDLAGRELNDDGTVKTNTASAGGSRAATPPVVTDKLGRPKDGVRRDLAGRELNDDGTVMTPVAETPKPNRTPGPEASSVSPMQLPDGSTAVTPPLDPDQAEGGLVLPLRHR